MEPPFYVEDKEIFSELVQTLFTQRNKKVRNAILPFLRKRGIKRGNVMRIADSLTFHDKRVHKLAPEDFGIVGIALLALSALETFSRTGSQAALIQKRGDVESFLDTAWTVAAIRGIAISLILFCGAPAIARFFSSSQAALVIRVISIFPLLLGFKNIGIIFFQKDLEFNKQFIYVVENFLPFLRRFKMFKNIKKKLYKKHLEIHS